MKLSLTGRIVTAIQYTQPGKEGTCEQAELRENNGRNTDRIYNQLIFMYKFINKCLTYSKTRNGYEAI